jgi:hypothetical protein
MSCGSRLRVLLLIIWSSEQQSRRSVGMSWLIVERSAHNAEWYPVHPATMCAKAGLESNKQAIMNNVYRSTIPRAHRVALVQSLSQSKASNKVRVARSCT